MKKLINDPYQVVEETISGILKAHPYHLRMAKDSERALVRADAPVKGKVAICTGGGSGHIPVFLGYVGPGLLDGVSVGNVFSSPSANDMLAATKEVDGGAGVLYLFGNYQGDIMNFEMAAEMAEIEGIPVKLSIAKDDVASAPRSEMDHRRGVAGIFFAYKIAGAKADTKANLDEVKESLKKIGVDNLNILEWKKAGVTLSNPGKGVDNKETIMVSLIPSALDEGIRPLAFLCEFELGEKILMKVRARVEEILDDAGLTDAIYTIHIKKEADLEEYLNSTMVATLNALFEAGGVASIDQ